MRQQPVAGIIGLPGTLVNDFLPRRGIATLRAGCSTRRLTSWLANQG